MSRDPLLFLQDIEQASRKIVRYTQVEGKVGVGDEVAHTRDLSPGRSRAITDW